MTARPIRWFIIGIVSLVFLGIGSYFWATIQISSAESYRSPLANHPPAAGEPLGRPITRRVVVVLIDALRYDTSTNAIVMPFLNDLRSRAASAIMHSQPPSFSAPGWATLLTGAWPDINDSQPFNPPGVSSARPFTQEDIFAAASRSGLSTAVSGYAWFEQMLQNSGVSAGFYTPREDQIADEAVVKASLPWLSGDYQLILIHLDQVDFAGHHQGGPLNPNWDAAAKRVDELLRIIVSTLDLSQDTVLVVSDHGQIDQGGHGGAEPVTLIEPFILAGAGVRPGNYGNVNMVDVAPTLAAVLGTSIPATNQGDVLSAMLTLSPEQDTAIQEALRVQQSRLFNAYTSAIGASATISAGEIVSATQEALIQAREGKLAGERVWRNMAAVMIAILPVYFLYMRKDKKAFWQAGGALIYGLLFNFRYAILDHHTYSLSSIDSAEGLILYTATTAAIAFTLGWMVPMIGRRAFSGGPRRAASLTLGYTWMTVYLLSLPVLVSAALNGFTVTWTLPEFHTMFIGLISVIQWIFIAGIGLVLIGLSALVGILFTRTAKQIPEVP